MISLHPRILLPSLRAGLVAVIAQLFVMIPAMAAEGELADIAAMPTSVVFEKAQHAYRSNDLEKALMLYSVICSRHDPSASDEIQRTAAQSFLHRGSILKRHASYSLALDSYLQARAIAEKREMDDLLPDIYNKIGIIFSEINDYDTALFYYRKALARSEENTDVRQPVLNNILYVYALIGEPDSTRFYYNALENCCPHDDGTLYDRLMNRALLCKVEGNADSALLYFRKAAIYAADSLYSPICRAAAFSSMAKLYKEAGRADSAEHYFSINEKTAREHNQNDLLLESLRELADINDLRGRHEDALRYKEQYLAVTDSIFSRDELNKIKNTQSLYELDSSANTIDILSTLTSRQRYWILTLVAFLCVVTAMAIVVYRQKAKLATAYAKLYETSREQLRAESYYKKRISELETPSSDEHDNASTQTRKLMQTKQQRDRIVSQILDVLRNTDDYCRTDYTIENLAASIGSNSRYVSEVINEEFGMNFRALLNEYRIKKSMIMLADYEKYGNLTIKAIAESVGYRSQSTFIALFTRQTGLKPSLYQQLSRKQSGS